MLNALLEALCDTAFTVQGRAANPLEADIGVAALFAMPLQALHTNLDGTDMVSLVEVNVDDGETFLKIPSRRLTRRIADMRVAPEHV